MGVCVFCSGESSYTCPRCSADYCGLKCYQSSGHRECSEQFYKDCVRGELVGDNLGDESKQKMKDILIRMNAEDNKHDEDGDTDSDDESDPEDLSDRLAGVDLDQVDNVWDKLTKDERRQFDELVKSGDVTSILPEFTPWWTIEVKVKKIKDLDEPDDDSYTDNCPKVWDGVRSLANMCSKEPSPYVKFGLLNVLYSYAYAVKYFNGDHSNNNESDFVEIVQLLSGSLSGHNYDLADTAVEAAASEVNNHQFLAISLEFSRQVKKDVFQLVKGPTGSDNFFILSALSDLRDTMDRCTKLNKRDKVKSQRLGDIKSELPVYLREQGRTVDINVKVVKKNIKKVEFYLAWSRDYYHEFSLLLDNKM